MWFGEVLSASERRHKCVYFAQELGGEFGYLRHEDGEPWRHTSFLGATQEVDVLDITRLTDLPPGEQQEVSRLAAAWKASPDPAELWFAQRNAPPGLLLMTPRRRATLMMMPLMIPSMRLVLSLMRPRVVVKTMMSQLPIELSVQVSRSTTLYSTGSLV